MEFLKGAALTKKMRSILRTRLPVDIAIAYWGADALKLLKVKPDKRNVRVVCCLKGGKSDPDIIEKFKKRAKQHDKLHAKVIWTPTGAIVGSANASSNGLPEEDFKAIGLIEAGMYVEDPGALQEIAKWFNDLYSVRARSIAASDLKDARWARELAGGSGGGGSDKSKSLLDLARAVLKAKVDQPISLAMFSELAPKSTDKAARRYRDKNSGKLEQALKIERKQIKDLGWYVNWRNLPRNHYLIDCHMVSGQIRSPRVFQTFHSTKGINVDGDAIHYVLDRYKKGFDFRLTVQDAKVIRACSKELWNKAIGDKDGKLISLKSAAPILLKTSMQRRLR